MEPMEQPNNPERAEAVKRCVMGDHIMPLTAFYKDKKTVDGLQASCLDCYDKRRRLLYKVNKLHIYRYDLRPKRHCDVCEVEICEGKYKRHVSGKPHIRNLKKLASVPVEE